MDDLEGIMDDLEGIMDDLEGIMDDLEDIIDDLEGIIPSIVLTKLCLREDQYREFPANISEDFVGKVTWTMFFGITSLSLANILSVVSFSLQPIYSSSSVNRVDSVVNTFLDQFIVTRIKVLSTLLSPLFPCVI